MKTLLDAPLYQGFVDPRLCQDLVSEGLLIKAPFCWSFKNKLDNSIADLISLQFDEDKYYEQAFHNLKAIAPWDIYAAFQTGDMIKLLPDFMLTRNNNEYELHCSSLFALDVEKADRMPDVFAKMVLKGIQERKIDVLNAIVKITVQ